MIETDGTIGDFRCSSSQMVEQLEQMNRKYVPDERLIENPTKLRSLYQNDDLTIREIAENHASVGRTSVYKALHEHDIIENEESGSESKHDSSDVDWSRMTG